MNSTGRNIAKKATIVPAAAIRSSMTSTRRDVIESRRYLKSGARKGVPGSPRGKAPRISPATLLQSQHFPASEQANRFFQAPVFRLLALGGLDPRKIPSPLFGRQRLEVAQRL